MTTAPSAAVESHSHVLWYGYLEADITTTTDGMEECSNVEA